MANDLDGLRAIVSDGALGGVVWEPDDIPYFQEPSPFWKTSVQAASKPLNAADFLSALEAFGREEPQPCAHLEPGPGWARRMSEAGHTEVSCPWCGARCALPPFGPRRPPLADG